MPRTGPKVRQSQSGQNAQSTPSDHIMEEETEIGIGSITRDPPRPASPQFQEPMPRVLDGGPSQSAAPSQYPQGPSRFAAPSQYPQGPYHGAPAWRAPNDLPGLQSQQYHTASYPHGYGPGHGYDSAGFAGRTRMQYPDMERSLQTGRMDMPMGSRGPYGLANPETAELRGRVGAIETFNSQMTREQREANFRMEMKQDAIGIAVNNLTMELRRSVTQGSQGGDGSSALLPRKRARGAAGAVKRAKRPLERDILNFNGADQRVLDFLKKMDCTSDGDLADLANLVRGKVSFEFLLSSESGLPRIYYFLKIGGSLSMHLAADPEDQPEQPESDETVVDAMSALELQLDDTEFSPVAGQRAAHNDWTIDPPKYVVPLGEVYLVNRSHKKAQSVHATNYFVVMDITTPQKGLWMVHRYNRDFERRDGNIQWDTIQLIGTTSFFKGTTGGFDMVRLLASVMDWRSPEEEMVAMAHVAEAMSREGSARRYPSFYLPTLVELKEAVKEGWEAKPEVDPAVKQEEEEDRGLAA